MVCEDKNYPTEANAKLSGTDFTRFTENLKGKVVFPVFCNSIQEPSKTNHLNLLEKNSKPPCARFRWLYWHPHFAKMVFPLNCVSLLKSDRLEETGILVHNQPRFRFTYSCKTHHCHCSASFKVKSTDLSSLFGPAPAHDDTLIPLEDLLSSLVDNWTYSSL